MKRMNGKSRISPGIAAGSIEDLVRAIDEDHDDLRKFIEILKNETIEFEQKKRALDAFTNLLKSHSISEEKSLYVRCLEVPELRILATEGYVEHALANRLMKAISRTHRRDRWIAEVKVLAELVEHHIDEEESEMLPHVEKYFGRHKREDMAHEFFSLRKRSQRNYSEENAGVLKG